MIQFSNVTRRFDDHLAVDDLSFIARPGLVTGLLGPSSAGKTTALRLVAGLDRPTSGHVMVNGRSLRHRSPTADEVGVLVPPQAWPPPRTVASHLLTHAQAGNVSWSRVDELIELLGLRDVARRRVGSLPSREGRRVCLAAALLSRPASMVLDEPMADFEPETVGMIGHLLHEHAAAGNTVLISSRRISDVAATVDRLVVIDRGRLVSDGTVTDFIDEVCVPQVTVRSPDAHRLYALLVRRQVAVTSPESGRLEVCGATSEQVGDFAFAHEVRLFELTARRCSPEAAYQAFRDGQHRPSGMPADLWPGPG